MFSINFSDLIDTMLLVVFKTCRVILTVLFQIVTTNRGMKLRYFSQICHRELLKRSHRGGNFFVSKRILFLTPILFLRSQNMHIIRSATTIYLCWRNEFLYAIKVKSVTNYLHTVPTNVSHAEQIPFFGDLLHSSSCELI